MSKIPLTGGKKRRALRVLAVFGALAVAITSLTGCKSTIGPAIEESLRRAEVRELHLDEMFSEKDGFHYPGYSWGGEFGDFQKAADFPVSGIAGYSEDGTFYDCADWHVEIAGIRNNGATVATDMAERVQMVMFEFGDSENLLTKEEFEAFAEEIGRHFDVEPALEERDQTEDVGTYHYATYYWRYTLPDGKETSLQWASATVKGAKNPMATTFSLSYIAPEETDETP